MVQAYSIGKDTRKDISHSPMTKLVPGPGTYKGEKETVLNQSPCWGFGTGKRPEMAIKQASKDVGPGQYAVPQRAIEGSRYSMGSINHKQKKYGSISPGPGAYKPRRQDEVSLSFSMGTKFSSSLVNRHSQQLPGPGGYDPVPQYKYDGHTKFGSSQRAGIYDPRKAKFVPGPNVYKQEASYVQKSAAKFSFGTSKQRPQTSKVSSQVPGPGHYPVKSIVGNESVGKTLSQKLCPAFERPGASNVPGPGTYGGDFKSVKSKEPEWRIGTSQRDERANIMRRTCNFPPPDQYDPKFQTVKDKCPLWGFGTSKRKGLTVGKSVAPSMQSYNIPSRAVEGSKWIMGVKLESSLSNTRTKFVPGPGNYEPDFKATQKAKPSYSMKGRYNEQKKLNTPGPGTYKKNLADKKQAPSFGFGSSPQREKVKQTLSPGPGGYKIPSMIADVPTYSLPNRKEEFKYI